MSGGAEIDLSEDDRRLVLRILAAHLPRESAVWVFGSRATGRARPYSDLDLAIDAGRPPSLDETALAEAFSDGDLPYRVDIVDWRCISEQFRQLIAAERRELFGAASAPTAQEQSSRTVRSAG